MILYSIANSPSDNSRDVYKAYISLSNSSSIKPWGYTRFLHYLTTLENQSFIQVYKGKKEEEGQKNIVVTKISLKVRQDVIKEEFNNRQIEFIQHQTATINESRRRREK